MKKSTLLKKLIFLNVFMIQLIRIVPAWSDADYETGFLYSFSVLTWTYLLCIPLLLQKGMKGIIRGLSGAVIIIALWIFRAKLKESI